MFGLEWTLRSLILLSSGWFTVDVERTNSANCAVPLSADLGPFCDCFILFWTNYL